MIPLTLAEVTTLTSGDLHLDCAGPLVVAGRARLPEPGTPVTGVVIDSREVVPGSLFLAFPGERADGHDFATAAVGSGCGRGVGQPAGGRAARPAPRLHGHDDGAWVRSPLR